MPSSTTWQPPGNPVTLYRRFGKRALDIAAGTLMLAALSPFIVITAATVAACLGRPVMFRQRRPGLDGRPFTLLKFRTMTDTRGADGAWLPDEQRLTGVGRMLRRLSLDELPGLWNVVRGDMSLVGPRPLLMQYAPRYTPAQARRHEVRPGVTGLAQVDGRNLVSWEEKFRLDVAYVERVSLLLDLRIALKTARIVLRQEGISAAGCATMTEFMGEKPAPTPGSQASDARGRPSPAGNRESS